MNATGQPVVLFACFSVDAEPWIEKLGAGTAFELRVWPDAGPTWEVDYIVAWNQPHGFLANFPNLKAVFCTGAGVDRMLTDPLLPNVPIARMVDEGLVQGMTEFVLAQTLYFHQRMPEYKALQTSRTWLPTYPPLASERVVGVLGLGQLGAQSAARLAEIGFAVRGWSRAIKTLPRIACFSGPDGLNALLDGCQILICLLPLTAETEGILNRSLFTRLSQAYLINVGRGAHLVEEDLIPALDAGHLAGALLDVFRTEPLPADSAFWSDPRIIVTPHAAAVTRPQTAAVKLLENLNRALAGLPLLDVVDRAKSY